MEIRSSEPSPSTIKTFLIALAASAAVACSNGSSTNSGPVDNDPEPETTVALDFVVRSYDGALLEGVNVTLGEESLSTDGNGKVDFSVPASDEVVVQAEMDGYISQAVTVPADDDSLTPIRLMLIKQILSVEGIEEPRTISGNTLGARITVPADAFVTPDGDPASGNAAWHLTPWDITSGELNAMPGNGQALDASSDRTELISAGMITVDVYNSAGEALQLAPNATADIQMDLPIDSINNQSLSVGSTIPMWHFDEAQGLWVEDEDTVGTVVASATSPVGLAVHAEVSHFSTWNWDFKFENNGSIDVECRMADSTPVPCAITADITLDDGSVVVRNGQVPAGGSTIVNMPNSAEIDWYASAADGFLGQENSNMPDDVVITLGEPTTSNDVRCELPDGTPIACQVSVSQGAESLIQTIPPQGATVATAWPGIDNNTTLTWSAETLTPTMFNQENVVGEGTATSDVSEDVVISLNTTAIEEISANCAGVSGTTLPCTLDITASIPNDSPVTTSHYLGTEGGTVLVPADATMLHWSAVADGTFSQNGQFVDLSGEADTGVVNNVTVVLDNEVVVGTAQQSMEVKCVNGQTSSATTCDITINREGSQSFSLIADLQGVPVDEYQMVDFPNGMSNIEWLIINATGDDDSFGGDSREYADLTEDEQIDLELN